MIQVTPTWTSDDALVLRITGADIETRRDLQSQVELLVASLNRELHRQGEIIMADDKDPKDPAEVEQDEQSNGGATTNDPTGDPGTDPGVTNDPGKQPDPPENP